MTYSDRRRIIRKYGFLLLAVLLIFVSGCGQEEEGYRDAAERREEAVGPAQYRDVAGTVWTDLWEMKIPGDRGAEEKVVNVKMNRWLSRGYLATGRNLMMSGDCRRIYWKKDWKPWNGKWKRMRWKQKDSNTYQTIRTGTKL